MFFLSNSKRVKRQLEILKNIFERSEDFLSPDRYEFCIDLIEHNEIGIALEVLCSNIEDNGIAIPNSLYLDIEELLESWTSVHDISYYDIKISDIK